MPHLLAWALCYWWMDSLSPGSRPTGLKQMRILFRRKIGDAAWQAEWELFAILLAIDHWLPIIRKERIFLVQSDAMAALHATQRSAGRTPIMNALSAEVALRLESAMVHVSLEHYRGTLNFECDALSRLSQGAVIPERLLELPRSCLKERRHSFFWAWPRVLLEKKQNAPLKAIGRRARGKRGAPLRHLAPPAVRQH